MKERAKKITPLGAWLPSLLTVSTLIVMSETNATEIVYAQSRNETAIVSLRNSLLSELSDGNQTFISQVLPPPPSTPPPNQTRSGGSLSGGENSCQRSDQPIRALVPVENPVFTASAHPTILLYVPQAAAEIAFGEFSVLVGLDETERLYQTRFTLPNTPGIVSISLPESPDYALETAVPYHWYVKLYCQGNTTSVADLEVNAWIQRSATLPAQNLPDTNISPQLWYDTLAETADRLQTAPQTPELLNQWRNLLESIAAGDLAAEPIVGAVQVNTESAR